MIADLFQEKLLGRQQLLNKMQELADSDAHALRTDLNKAVAQQPKKIVLLTHVPPFREACQHMGQISDDNYLPYFSSKAIGDVLLPVAQDTPSVFDSGTKGTILAVFRKYPYLAWQCFIKSAILWSSLE
jgi:hypothetical protein